MLIFMLFAPQMNMIFAISTSNNPIINKIYAWERWRTSAWYLPNFQLQYLLALSIKLQDHDQPIQDPVNGFIITWDSMGRIVADIVGESWLFELFNCKFSSYSSSTHNSQHSLKIMIRHSTTSLRRVDPDLDFKGTNPALKKPSNIPEIYAKMFGRFHWSRL